MCRYGFTYVGQKKMKNGITSGTCITAATKAALHYMAYKESSCEVELSLPNGQVVNVPILSIEEKMDGCVAWVRKDGGDDPDITHGTPMGVFVAQNHKDDHVLIAGSGVGVVTKPGLPVDVGQPAINPVPRRMILGICEEYREEVGPVDVTVFVEKGEVIGKRTLNPKLGIIGGISILGTTGIVRPMSEEAFKDSMRVEIEMYFNQGHKTIILVPGNYGHDFCKDYYNEELPHPIVKYSNFLGYVLEQCERVGFKKIILVGDIGKLIKVSGGIFHTHSKVADCRLELMGLYTAVLGGRQDMVTDILELPTTIAAIDYLEARNFDMEKLYDIITQRVLNRVLAYTHDSIDFEIMLFSRDKGLLGRSGTGE